MKIAYFRDNIAYISHIYVYFWLIYQFCVFYTITMGSATYQKNFLDKQSETCQKDSSYKKSRERSEEKIRFVKIAYFLDNIAYISHICVHFD